MSITSTQAGENVTYRIGTSGPGPGEEWLYEVKTVISEPEKIVKGQMVCHVLIGTDAVLVGRRASLWMLTRAVFARLTGKWFVGPIDKDSL